MTVEMIELDCIYPNPWQTRTGEPDPDYIASLAVDIALNGLLQTPIGRRRGDDEEIVELAFGHNRLAAFVHLAADYPDTWGEMPVDIRDLSDEQMANFAWSENEKRRDISPIERAKAIQRRMEDFGWTNRQVEEHLGVDHSTVSNILRLLKLPADIQEAIQKGEVSERQAQAVTVLFELPEFTEIPYYKTKRDILGAMFGGASSDWLRNEVGDYLKRNGQNLAQAEFNLTEVFKEGKRVYCGTCSACDKRLASRNLCFDKVCFAEKTDRRRQLYLASASVDSGYGMLDPDKEGYPSGIPEYMIEDVKATKCPNLVLAWGEPQDDRYAVKGYPKAHLVCEKRNQSCSCVKGLRANLSHRGVAENTERDLRKQELEYDLVPAPGADQPTPEKGRISSTDLEEAARQVRKAKRDVSEKMETVRELVVQRLVDGFAADHPGAFYLASNHYAYPSTIPDIERCYRNLATRLVGIVLPVEAASVEQLLEYTNRKLEALGLDPVRLVKTMVEVFGGEDDGHDSAGV
jgi:ParB/RepB/Spo0J family partition protein